MTTYTAKFSSGAKVSRTSAHDYTCAYECKLPPDRHGERKPVYGFSKTSENAKKAAQRELSARGVTGEIEIVEVTK